MDFRTLSRRELQALCKKNKIPANITNVAMADALSALPSVEGIEEFLNGERSGVPESPMKEDFVSSDNPRTALRTSTRRKAVKDEAITTRSRRTAAARGTEESENRDLNLALTTPSLPGGWRRTAAVSSACKKVDFQMTVDQKEDNDLDQEKKVFEKTPAVPKAQTRLPGASTRKQTETRNNGHVEQRVYSTRRSVRLLEKNMESLSLGDDGKIEPIAAVHMSFDDMPNCSEPVKEDTELETEIKKPVESEYKLDEDLSVEKDDQDKKEMESEVKPSKQEQEMEEVTSKISDDSETEALHADSDVKCFPEVEEAIEASKDDDAVEIPAEEINESDKFPLPTEDEDLTEVVHNFEESGIEVKSKRNDSICELEHVIEANLEEEVKLMNVSAEELSLPHENVEEETQFDDDDVLSSDEESVMGAKDDEDEYDYESDPTTEEGSDDDIDEDEKETEMEKSPVQAEEDDSEEFPENASEDLVDVMIQGQLEEEAPPKDINVEAIHDNSQPEIPNDNVLCKEEAMVENMPTSSNNNGVQSSLANQFPRPTVETKSPIKEQTISMLMETLMENSDAEEEEEEKAKCSERQMMEKNDMSLRQLKKMFKEKLQLSKKKMDNNNNNNISSKVVGGKVRTALQPLPENRMTMDEVEKRV